MNIECADEINSKDDLADFVERLRLNLLNHPDEWENPDLERFLAAMGAWVRSMDMYVKNSSDNDLVNPSWSTFAKILMASKFYE